MDKIEEIKYLTKALIRGWSNKDIWNIHPGTEKETYDPDNQEEILVNTGWASIILSLSNILGFRIPDKTNKRENIPLYFLEISPENVNILINEAKEFLRIFNA